jgi:hypothetical protein
MRRFVFAALALAVSGAPASAQNSPLWQDYVTPYVGAFNILDDDEDTSGQFGVEYRFRQWNYGIRPTVGVNIDWDGGAYAYGGFNWEIPLSDSFLLIPNFMVGAYHEGGSKDLGGALEFRSGIEVAYQCQNKHRIGLAFNHISNASIYDKNPGAEALLLTYSLPAAALR